MGINKNDAKSFEEMAEEQNVQETPVVEATAETAPVAEEAKADNAETTNAE